MVKRIPIASSLALLCSLATLATLSIMLSGCASRMAKQQREESQENAAAAQNQNPKYSQQALEARLDDIEAKIAAMNDKLTSTRQALDGFLAAHGPQGAGVPMQPSDTVGIPVTAAPLATGAEAGFVDDDAIHQYRKASILLETQRYAEAVTAFTTFLNNYPDHPLAGSAQYHIGEADLRQKKYLGAEQEFQKVLTSYDRSPHVSDTLRLMAEAEDALGKTEAAARHRQLLTSLFASSPAAAQAQSQPQARAQSPIQAQPQQQEDAGIPANPVTPLAKPGLDEPPPTANLNQ